LPPQEQEKLKSGSNQLKLLGEKGGSPKPNEPPPPAHHRPPAGFQDSHRQKYVERYHIVTRPNGVSNVRNMSVSEYQRAITPDPE
jgi:hypothetical protein